MSDDRQSESDKAAALPTGAGHDLRRRSVRAGAAVLSGQIFVSLLHLVATMILARLLTPTDFGLVAMSLAMLSSATMLRDLGLTSATIQQKDLSLDSVNTLFWINAGMGGLLTAIIFFLAPAIVWLFNEPKLLAVTQALAVVSLIDGLAIQHQALIRRQLRLGVLASVEVVATAVALTVAILLAYRGAGYWALVAMHIIQIGIRTMLCWSAAGWHPVLSFRRADVARMLSFGTSLTVSRLLNNLTRIVDKILVGRFANAEQLGLYSKAYNAILLPSDRVNTALSRVAVPTLSRLQEQPKRFRTYYLKALMLVATAVFPALAGVFLEAKSLLLIVLGDQWVKAAPLIQVLAPVAAITIVSMTLRWVLVSLGAAPRLLKWQTIESSGKVFGIVIGIRWGAEGVAAGLLMSTALLMLPGFYFCLSGTSIRIVDVTATLWKPIAASLAAIGAVLTLRSLGLVDAPFFPSLLTEVALFASVYFATWLVLPQGRADLMTMLALAREFRSKSPPTEAVCILDDDGQKIQQRANSRNRPV